MNGPAASLPIDLDALARVAFDAFSADGTPYTAAAQGIFRRVVTAVLESLFAHLADAAAEGDRP